MPSRTKDARIVLIDVTRAELTTLLGERARATGVIDFDPDRAEVVDNGESGFEIRFEKDTPPSAGG